MALSLDQVKEKLKSPKSKNQINKAIKHEDRLRLHTETAMQHSEISSSVNLFLTWVKELIPIDKYTTFLALFRYPVSTNDLVDQIFHSLSKIFDGRDPLFDYSFNSDDAGNDWAIYKDERLGGNEFWENKAYSVMQSAINSVMIVDLPRLNVDGEGNLNQDSFIPEPKMLFHHISSIHDFCTNKEGLFDYLMIIKKHKDSNDELFVYDDESYRVFLLNDNREITGEPTIESFHDLGYTPARFFWTTPLNMSDFDIKKSPLSNQLTNLDKLLFSIISKEHLDLYAAYPIYYGYEVDCDYEHPENGEHCDGGFIKSDNEKYTIDGSGGITKCPRCSANKLAGAGGYVEMPFPDVEQGISDIKVPIGLLSVDQEALNYNRDEVVRKKTEVYTNVVGIASSLPKDQALNTFQIAASFESQEAVLISFQRDFELAQKWSEETICKLRYGDMFISASISYGTVHNLLTINELTERYKQAKEAGAHESELDSLQDQIMESDHSNNPFALKRAKILSQLEPYRHMTRSEVLDSVGATPSIFDNDDTSIKINFSNFIARFERENINVVEFGVNISLEEKINRIYETLKTYVTRGKTEIRQEA